MKKIDISTPMYPNTFTMVDDADFDWLNQWKWGANKIGKTIYAIRKVRISGNKSIAICMHRLIMGLKGDVLCDHVNSNGLDNRRRNLRSASQKQNLRNRGPNKTNTSGFKGVTWSKNQTKWLSQLYADGQNHYLGCFVCITRAAIAYNQAAVKYYGKFAWLNPVKGNCDAIL